MLVGPIITQLELDGTQWGHKHFENTRVWWGVVGSPNWALFRKSQMVPKSARMSPYCVCGALWPSKTTTISLKTKKKWNWHCFRKGWSEVLDILAHADKLLTIWCFQCVSLSLEWKGIYENMCLVIVSLITESARWLFEFPNSLLGAACKQKNIHT